jgi:hypothetical protein
MVPKPSWNASLSRMTPKARAMNRRALCLMCVLGVIGTPVAAICPSPVPKACSLFFDSEAVFVAKLLIEELRHATKSSVEGEVLSGLPVRQWSPRSARARDG